jgi:hypothetical protein
VPEGRAVHGVGVGRGIALPVAAEGAENGTVLILVDALADQHRALTTAAMFGRLGQIAKAAPHERELELGHVTNLRVHATGFRARCSGSCINRCTAANCQENCLIRLSPAGCGEEVSKNWRKALDEIDRRTIIVDVPPPGTTVFPA